MENKFQWNQTLVVIPNIPKQHETLRFEDNFLGNSHTKISGLYDDSK